MEGMQNENLHGVREGVFTAHLAFNVSWGRYFAEYQTAVESLWSATCQEPILPDKHSLPLLFLVRHTIELGYKMNLSDLYGATEPKDLAATHNLADLHTMVGDALESFFNATNWVSEEIKQECRARYREASLFKNWLHQLDKLNDAFRYPFKTKSVNENGKNKRVTNSTPHFDFSQQVNLLKEVIEPYRQTLVFLNHTYDVLGLNEFMHMQRNA